MVACVFGESRCGGIFENSRSGPLVNLWNRLAIVGWKTEEEAGEYAKFMNDFGYSLVHESTGEMYFKDAVQQPDSYRIYKRKPVVVLGTGRIGM